MRANRRCQLERPRNPSRANCSIMPKLAAADVVIKLPGASCLDQSTPIASLRRCAFITSPILVLDWNLRLVLDAVLVIQRFLAVLWILQLANADIAF